MFRSMKRIVLLLVFVIACGIGGGVYWLSGQSYEFSFNQQQIEEQINRRFPIEKKHLVIVSVHYENPRIVLTNGSSDLGIGLDARVKVTVPPKEVTGSADLLTKIGYDPENGTFYLREPRLVDFKIPGVPQSIVEHVTSLTNALVSERISGIPIYKIQPTDVKTQIARLVLKSITIRDGILYIELGL